MQKYKIQHESNLYFDFISFLFFLFYLHEFAEWDEKCVFDVTAMSERRSVFILFIGLMLCISLWRISLQELHTEYTSYDAIEPLNIIYNDTKTNTTSMNTTVQKPIAPLKQLAKTDANVLIDLNNFDYLINQPACHYESSENNNNNNKNDPPPIALILVHSAPQNRHKRNTIRQTWGKPDARMRIYFLLGAVNTTTMQTQLMEESNMFHDIIQGNFFDTYRNMTYKHTMALKWFVYNCPKLKYLLKTDDDVFVNMPAVFEFLKTGISDDQSLLFCYQVSGARIKRTYRSKWRVSTKEFPGWYYPNYCPGFSIIYSNDVVWRLYQKAQECPYFWIDDVHITGSLAQHVNVSITTFGKYYMNKTRLNALIDGQFQLNDMKPVFLFTEPNLSARKIRQLWEIVKTSSDENIYR